MNKVLSVIVFLCIPVVPSFAAGTAESVTLPPALPPVAGSSTATATVPSVAPVASVPPASVRVPASPKSLLVKAGGPSSFDQQISAALQGLGVGPFNQLDTSSDVLSQLPVYRPFQIPVGAPYGSVYGMAEVLAGFDVAGHNLSDYPNLEVVGTVNVGDHLRGHLQANLYRFPWSNSTNRGRGLPELYAEYYTDGVLGKFTSTTYHTSVQLGKVGQQQFPFIDPLVLFDRLPGAYAAYQGAMATGEVDNRSGLGFHTSLYERIGNSGTYGKFLMNDAYGVYRHYAPSSKMFYEGRLGWVPYAMPGSPSNGELGAQGYVGYQTGMYGGGVFVGQSFRRGTTVGIGVTLGRNPATELFGLAPSRLMFKPDNFAVEAPVAQFYFASALAAPTGQNLVGQLAEIHTWNAGSGTGVGSTNVIPAGHWGVQSGQKLYRVVSATPWWLYEDNMMHLPDARSRRNTTGWENNAHFRSDVEYSYYSPSAFETYHVNVTAVDAETQMPISGALITLAGTKGFSVAAPITTSDGVTVLDFQQPTGSSRSFHITGTAPLYLPVSEDIPLTPGSHGTLVVPFQKLMGTVSGVVKDTATGAPVDDAEVILISNADPSQHIVLVTDNKGFYQFTKVAPGSYTLRLHKPGYNDQDQQLTVSSPNITVNIETAAQKGGIVGQIVDMNNNPVHGATITVVDADGKALLTQTTGTDGSFVQRVAPGTYTVNVSAVGFSPATATVIVLAGQLQNVTITMISAK